MKNLFLTTVFFAFASILCAQLPRMAVISFDATNTQIQTAELTELLRIEVTKHGKYEIVDRYEIQEALTNDEVSVATCFSKTCLLKAGKILNVDYLLSGSVDKLGEALFMRIRLLNLKAGTIEKEIVKEFLYIPEKINTMISICSNDMHGIENDQTIVSSLSNIESYESAINNPYYQRLNLSGPRMGYLFFTGTTADILRKPTNKGGFDASPAYFQMGYQFEKQYLSEGKWQALVEVIPLISGVDQGLIIPSLSILNGIRSNRNGLEFAIGPSFNVAKKADVIEVDGEYVLAEGYDNSEGRPILKRLDSRGKFQISSNVVIAAGFSLKSGKLNIPVNAYVIPAKNDLRVGVSFGFNTKKQK
jgi:hypothetical protein